MEQQGEGVALLLPLLLSVVADAAVAVFEITVPDAVAPATLTTSVKTLLPMPSEGSVHETVPPAPAAGVVHDQAAGLASDTKVVPEGSVSVRVAFAAKAGPAFVTVIV